MVSKGLRTYVRTIVIAFLVLVGAVLAIALTMFVVHRVQVAQIRGLYDEMVAVSEQAEYRRTPDPPGWDLEPGSAAELYEAALASCPQVSALSNTSSVNLNLALRAMHWDSLSVGDRAPLIEPGSVPIHSTCQEAGIPADSLDRIVAQPDIALCQILVDCDEPLALLLAGTRREENRSPAWVWADWGIDPAGGIDVAHGIQVGSMAKLLVLRGYTAELGSDSGAWLEGSLGAVRFGGDMTRGSGQSGGYLGLRMRHYGARSLQVALEHGVLAVDAAAQLQDELAYINRQPIDHGDMLAHEALIYTVALGFSRSDDPVPPAARYWHGTFIPTAQRALIYVAAGNLMRFWRESLTVQSSPYPARLAVYNRLDDDFGNDPPAVASLPRATAMVDARVTLSNTHLELLELAAAATVMRMETGAAPSSLDDLLAFDADLPTEDLFTGEPYGVAVEDGQCVIRSPAAPPARHAEVGLDKLLNIDPTERLVVEIPLVVKQTEVAD